MRGMFISGDQATGKSRFVRTLVRGCSFSEISGRMFTIPGDKKSDKVIKSRIEAALWDIPSDVQYLIFDDVEFRALPFLLERINVRGFVISRKGRPQTTINPSIIIVCGSFPVFSPSLKYLLADYTTLCFRRNLKHGAEIDFYHFPEQDIVFNKNLEKESNLRDIEHSLAIEAIKQTQL